MYTRTIPGADQRVNGVDKSFTSFADAESFLAGIDPSLDPNSSSFVQTKFYGVQRGRVPGVYTNWPSAQQQIVGFTRPRHRGFATRAEAETFVKEGDVADVRTESPQPSTHAPRQVDQASLTVAAPNFAPGAPLGKGTEPVPKKPKRPRKDAKASQEIANLAMPTNVLGMPAGDPDFDPGTGPLLPGIEDDFDPQVVLNPHTGQIEWKTDTQKRKTVMQSTGPKPDGVLRIYTDGSSLKNGQGGAIGGIGVYFGDGDPRLALAWVFLFPATFPPSVSPPPPPPPTDAPMEACRDDQRVKRRTWFTRGQARC